jgi:hypothetical protein
VTYKNITNNKTKNRNHVIDTITIHCYVGQVTAKQGCDYFATTKRQCSANYVVGMDGSIGLSVDEKDRAWTTSNAGNDNRAVTIEVACDNFAPYKVTTKAYNALIDLVADICKRNGIKQLLWKGDKNLKGDVTKQNMTVHRWFSATACPGDYLYGKHSDIANKVNIKLAPTKTAAVIYRVRKTWGDIASQLGAFTNLTNAKKLADNNVDYEVYDEKGNIVYEPPKKVVKTLKKGSVVKVKRGAKSYEGKKIASFVYNGQYKVDELKGNRAVLDKKGICTAFNVNDLIVI